MTCYNEFICMKTTNKVVWKNAHNKYDESVCVN